MYPQPASEAVMSRPSAESAHLFLARLKRLVALEPVADVELDAERLLRKAIYSTYMDCRAHGLKREAQLILASIRQPARRRAR